MHDKNASKLALSLWERERVRENSTLTPSPSPKGEGKNGGRLSVMLHVSAFWAGNCPTTPQRFVEGTRAGRNRQL
jgi:hypothetical protein